MGVTGLFKVISGCASRMVPVSDIAGKTIAVDLSSWIVESRNVKVSRQGLTSLYIRNLFFRSTALMCSGVKLVFILDGTIPQSKIDTMRNRAKLMWNNKGNGPQSPIGPSGSHEYRSWFRQTEEKSIELLESLGLPWIRSPGEAEAYCAGLCINKIVDAVFTSDSDVFLYGARSIYRKLCQENRTWSIEETYSMDDIEREYDLDRESLVAMAILVGCDYCIGGVKDIGPEKALGLFQEMRSNGVSNVLDRMKEWRENSFLQGLQTEIDSKDSQTKKPNHCSKCGHAGGSKAQHEQNGCHDCSTEKACTRESTVPCNCGSYIHDKEKYKLELRYRQKSLQNSAFPMHEVITEFLEGSKIEKKPTIKWTDIDIPRLKQCLQSRLKWNDSEFYNKLAPVLVYTQLNTDQESYSPKVRPLRVMKECTRNRVPSVEVEWRPLESDRVNRGYFVTVDKEKFSLYYPDVMQTFLSHKEEEKAAKAKGRKRKLPVSSKESKMTDFFKVKKKASPTTEKTPIDLT